MKIGIFTAVCEKDMHWFPQFQKQCEILDIQVSWFADKLSDESLAKLLAWPKTFFVHDNQTEQFSERSKELALKGLKGFDWAIQMDIDETWEAKAMGDILDSLSSHPDGYIAECPMITVAKRDGQLFQRTDSYFSSGVESKRARIYNLKYEWHWVDPITCGAYCFIDGKQTEVQSFPCEATSVHWGYWTRDLLLEHKAKWEEIWTKTLGRIPYTTYETLSDKDYIFEMIPLEDKFYLHLWTELT